LIVERKNIMTKWTVADIPSQTGKLAVITGTTGGLGYESGRNADKGRDAIQRIRQKARSAKILFEKIDLGNLASVADFSNRLLGRNQPIALLINNAGMMTPPERKTTADGLKGRHRHPCRR
jgi:short-subunit dehydrogenase